MSDPVSLAEVRALKAEDSTLWSPLDAARSFVRRCEAGEIKPANCAIHYFEDNPDGGRVYHYMCAGLSFESHLALLEIAKVRLLDDWRR